jgi:hypothetical protein
MNLTNVSAMALLTASLTGRMLGQTPQEVRLDTIEKLELGNLKANIVTHLGHAVVRIANLEGYDSDYGEGLAIVRGVSLRDGTVEVTLSGNTAPDAPPELRGFVGVAFRVLDRSHFECIYIRPKNGRSGDQLQRNHSTQYISIPGFPWEKLRRETPGKYESYVDLVPGQWTTFKIHVRGKAAWLYINGAQQPTLIVNDLKQSLSTGGIALWVGQGTIAYFADLKIMPRGKTH